MRRLAVLGALVVCLSTTLRGQDGKALPVPGPIAESAARVAREWWPTDVATFIIDEEGRPRFRAGVTVTQSLQAPWQLSNEQLPLNYRGAISHQEMLRVMTPQEFSVPAMGGSVDPGEILNGIKKAWRDWQAQRIHARVTKELEDFLKAADAAPAQPVDPDAR